MQFKSKGPRFALVKPSITEDSGNWEGDIESKAKKFVEYAVTEVYEQPDILDVD